jgi:uncharacterized protein (DUF2141 family)
VVVLGLRSDAGKVRCLLFNSERGWPGDADKALAVSDVRPRDGRAVCAFEAPGPGRYAVAFLHDEDDDDRMTRGLFGMPVEGYGFSNDARAFLAPAAYRDAEFQHRAGPQELVLHTSYP